MWQKAHDEYRRTVEREHALVLEEKNNHIAELRQSVLELQSVRRAEVTAAAGTIEVLEAKMAAYEQELCTARTANQETELLRERFFNSMLLSLKLGAMTTGQSHLLRQVDWPSLCLLLADLYLCPLCLTLCPR